MIDGRQTETRKPRHICNTTARKITKFISERLRRPETSTKLLAFVSLPRSSALKSVVSAQALATNLHNRNSSTWVNCEKKISKLHEVFRVTFRLFCTAIDLQYFFHHMHELPNHRVKFTDEKCGDWKKQWFLCYITSYFMLMCEAVNSFLLLLHFFVVFRTCAFVFSP